MDEGLLWCFGAFCSAIDHRELLDPVCCRSVSCVHVRRSRLINRIYPLTPNPNCSPWKAFYDAAQLTVFVASVHRVPSSRSDVFELRASLQRTLPMRVVLVLSGIAVATAFPARIALSHRSTCHPTASSSAFTSAPAYYDVRWSLKVLKGSSVQKAHNRQPRGSTALALSQQLQQAQPTPISPWFKLNPLHATHSSSPALMVRGGAGTSSTVKTRHGIYERIALFLNKRFFLLGAVVMVSAARLAPAIGATGGLLRPELTVNRAGESSCEHDGSGEVA